MRLIILMTLLANINFTIQQPDILFINNDEVKIRYIFPLEQLAVNKRPFGYSRKTAPNTSCWRGYTAQWIIQNDKLYLKSINRCYGDDNKPNTLDLRKYFNANNLKYQIENGLIHAIWFSGNLPIISSSLDVISNSKKTNDTEKNMNPTVAKINNGIVMEYQTHK